MEVIDFGDAYGMLRIGRRRFFLISFNIQLHFGFKDGFSKDEQSKSGRLLEEVRLPRQLAARASLQSCHSCGKLDWVPYGAWQGSSPGAKPPRWRIQKNLTELTGAQHARGSIAPSCKYMLAYIYIVLFIYTGLYILNIFMYNIHM